MKFIEKYWWILLILVIVAIVLYMYFSKKDTKTTTNVNDPCSATKFAAKIAEAEDAIDSTPAWKAQIETKVTTASDVCFGKTYEQCRRINAIYQLGVEGIIPASCAGKVS